MTIVLGDGVDARGFALAGAMTVHCRTAEDVRTAIDRMLTSGDAPHHIVFISRAVRALAPRDVDRLRDSRRGPLVVVLPDTESAR